jgi:hypothetical protein
MQKRTSSIGIGARQMLFGVACCWMLSDLTSAQSNVGELLDAGGKALSKDEVLAALKGATATGALYGGGETQIEWKDNGALSGYVVNATGRRGSIFGTWAVDESGKICRDYQAKFYETTQVKDCFVVYRLGDQYYFPGPPAPGDGRATVVLKRTFKR